MRSFNFKKLCLFLPFYVFISLVFVGCTDGSIRPVYTALDNYPISDMSKYSCSQDYKQQYQFVDITVKELAKEMENNTSFILYAGQANCPYCNSVLNYLNDIAINRNIKIAYLDVRSNPEWRTNLEIDDYDLFIQYFGSELELDDDGILHLYVPHVFFIKEGKLIGSCDKSFSDRADVSNPTVENQVQLYKNIISDYIDKLGI